MLSNHDIMISVILAFICIILAILSRFVLRQKNVKQLQKIFLIIFGLIFLWVFTMLIQVIFLNKFNMEIKYFYDIYYISICFLPLAFLFMAITFENGVFKLSKKHLLLFIIPILSNILLWTNDFHHLFYKEYSTSLSTECGVYFYIHTYYTFAVFVVALFILLRYTIKNAGFFSMQAILVFIGAIIPLTVNILGSLQIIELSIYATPIAMSASAICFALAIFKFKFLSITPIAMQRIVDRMSDSFVVVNEENVITDFNDTFLKTFQLTDTEVRNMNFIDLIKKTKFKTADVKEMEKLLIKCKSSTQTFQFKRNYKIKNNYFNIEVNGIFSKDIFLGNLILFKDVTQHMIDMQTIEENQSMLMEKERLASLGQMIGGIAHNLKTPIMSIAGASEGLSELTHEYDISIGDPEVTNEDHHAIVKDMDEWIRKIREYTEYMSDVITAVKGQAVNFSDETSNSFTINEAIKYIDVLMKHELKNALVNLNVNMLTDPSITIKGNINSFVQVINNMISNAIQSYNGEPNKDIDFTIDKVNNNIQFMIQDYGCGIPKSVQDKLFKEMITTKGKNGTGLGLFMSYSNIRAHFGGNVTFESEEGKGTKFIISIPVN